MQHVVKLKKKTVTTWVAFVLTKGIKCTYIYRV